MTDSERRVRGEGDTDAAALEQELAAIVQSSDDAIIGKTLDGTVTSWNPAAERFYGYAAEEAIGQPLAALIEPPHRAGEIGQILGRVAAGERIDHHETERISSDGRLIEVALSVSPIRAADGRIVGAAAIARDIGERKRAERYRETRLGLARILAENDGLDGAAPALLEHFGWSMGWDLGAMWVVEEGGEALSLRCRWRSQELPSKDHAARPTVTRFRPGEGLPGRVWQSGEPAWVEDVSADPQFPRSEVVAGEGVRGAIGLPIWSGNQVLGVLEFFSRYVSPPDAVLSELLAAVGGQVGTFLERVRAAEALKSAKEEAERANRAKDEFLSRMSHELRTPMNAILGFAQLLQLGELDESQRDGVTQILKAGRHLTELIDEVLDISRVEAGKLRLSIEPVAVGEVVQESLALVGQPAERRGIQLEADLGEATSGWVLADRQRLKQVLLNLLSNAIKYNREHGFVRVRLEPRPGERLAILISDSGPGISAEQRARLFQPFDRLGAERSEVEGTGLGLALSKRLVEAMGGTLKVDSAAGPGTTMSVELQRSEPQERAERALEAALLPAFEGTTLLYIEDNLANMRLVERVLERFPDVRLLPAMQGNLGLELAREHRPDLVLLDLHLPDLPGREVLLRLKAEPQLRDTPVVVLTAEAKQSERERLLAAGAHAYLTKPLDVPAFLSVIEESLGHPEPSH